MRLFYWNANGYNFGDAMGPDIVRAISGKRIQAIDGKKVGLKRAYERNLFALGSLLHMVQDGDVIWGTGANPVHRNPHLLQRIDVRAVRGPLTKDYLFKEYGIDCPGVFGDPALLLPKLFPTWRHEPKRKYGVVPHYHDIEHLSSVENNLILPTNNWQQVVSQILECELVVSSSLHGLIIAEAFGVPARWLRNSQLPSCQTESNFKFNDYYASTNRSLNDWRESIAAAIEAGGKEPIRDFDVRPLLAAFPHDLFAVSNYYPSLLTAKLEDTLRVARGWKGTLTARKETANARKETAAA
jgi:pyruvyltransferase